MPTQDNFLTEIQSGYTFKGDSFLLGIGMLTKTAIAGAVGHSGPPEKGWEEEED